MLDGQVHHTKCARRKIKTKNITNIDILLDSNKDTCRDLILRERREPARERNLADCGRICGSPHISVGSIEEMCNKCPK